MMQCTGGSKTRAKTAEYEIVGLTENGNGVGGRRQCLANYQQKDDQRQQDGDLEVDLLAGLDRQEKAEERDSVDEQARKDEVDDVEETASRHMDGERDGRVRLRAARVRLTPDTTGN